MFHGFVSEVEILRLAAASDVGLALELPTVDISRDLSITNKLLTYAVSGNYVLAIRTRGQVDFMGRLPDNGRLISAAPADMAQALREIFAQIAPIRAARKQRRQAARAVSWEAQTQKLRQLVQHMRLPAPINQPQAR